MVDCTHWYSINQRKQLINESIDRTKASGYPSIPEDIFYQSANDRLVKNERNGCDLNYY